jgi:hypothetical protein
MTVITLTGGGETNVIRPSSSGPGRKQGPSVPRPKVPRFNDLPISDRDFNCVQVPWLSSTTLSTALVPMSGVAICIARRTNRASKMPATGGFESVPIPGNSFL